MSRTVTIVCPWVWEIEVLIELVRGSRSSGSTMVFESPDSERDVRSDDADFLRYVKSARFFIIDFDELDAAHQLVEVFATAAVQRGAFMWIDFGDGRVLSAAAFLSEVDRCSSARTRDARTATCRDT